jgi:hypothetical protein
VPCKPWKSVSAQLVFLIVEPFFSLSGCLDSCRVALTPARNAGHRGASAWHLFPYPPAHRYGSREVFARQWTALRVPQDRTRCIAFTITGNCEGNTGKYRPGRGDGCGTGHAKSHGTVAGRADCIAPGETKARLENSR